MAPQQLHQATRRSAGTADARDHDTILKRYDRHRQSDQFLHALAAGSLTHTPLRGDRELFPQESFKKRNPRLARTDTILHASKTRFKSATKHRAETTSAYHTEVQQE